MGDKMSGNLFKRKIREFLNYILYEQDEPMKAEVSYSKNIVESNRTEIRNKVVRFVVFNAIGGKVIQTSYYNDKTDRTDNNLYVITDLENLGEEIGQIITRENLTR